MMEFKRFLVANLGALRRFFEAIATACSTGPTFGVSIFVTCKASGFLYHSEAGFANVFTHQRIGATSHSGSCLW